mmetsp:Transcript_39979/g.103200  ORF Transcript_39979/g.103200 Transcript_39979/m.103200 type:complete len:213 (-) Transcript_39979:1445-2083(-)
MFEFIKKGVEYLKEKSYVYKSRWRRRRWGAYFKKVLEKTAHIQSDGEVQQKVGCHIMGEYIPPISELEQHLKAEVMSMYWCTYRKDFEAIEDTSLTSDTGWGCMLRTAQMALCEVYSRHVMEEVPLSSSYDVLGRLVCSLSLSLSLSFSLSPPSLLSFFSLVFVFLTFYLPLSHCYLPSPKPSSSIPTPDRPPSLPPTTHTRATHTHTHIHM